MTYGEDVMRRERRTVTVAREYIGAVLSVNHYMGRTQDGSQYVKKGARQWMADLGWMLKTFHIEDWRKPIRIEISGVFKDARSCPDLHNLLKVACDAIEEVTDLNDRDFQTTTGKTEVDEARSIGDLYHNNNGR